ncbi:hypothetical protein TeGR_g14137, partial [Tetraparma gracilis]
RNAAIDRALSEEGVRAVCGDLVECGHGEWEDSGRTRVRVLWLKPAQLASDLLAWAAERGVAGGGVCTLYELHSGEDVGGKSFEGADEELLRRAVGILEEAGKCALFKGDTSEEDGVKFF